MKNIIFSIYLPVVAAGTLILGTVYASVQQNYRQSANDPQIEIAEDLATVLATGFSAPQNVGHIDMDKSLTPFIISYDETGTVTSASGYLNGKVPVPPVGALDYARTHGGQNRVTWEPEPGVRIAAVIVYFNGTKSGYVLTGRNLREVELREWRLELIAGFAWIVLVFGVGVLVWLGEWLKSRNSIQ